MNREANVKTATFAAAASDSSPVEAGPYSRGALRVGNGWEGGDIVFAAATFPGKVGGTAVISDAPTYSPIYDENGVRCRVSSPSQGAWYAIPAAVYTHRAFVLQIVDSGTSDAKAVSAERTVEIEQKS